MSIVLTPSQTCGPLYGFALITKGSDEAVPPGADGAVTIVGRVLDGDERPITWPEAFLEVWQGAQFARARTDAVGEYRVVARKPEGLTLPDGTPQAPHLNVAVFARGLLKQLVTRIYFPDEEAANAADPVLSLVDADARRTLVAEPDGDVLRFDIRIQGERETAFFDF